MLSDSSLGPEKGADEGEPLRVSVRGRGGSLREFVRAYNTRRLSRIQS